MSSPLEKFSIKITDPEELKIAKAYRDALQKLKDEGEALSLRHEQETKDWLLRHKKISSDHFRRLTEKHIPDPDEAFRTGEWYADITYVHLHGEAYLVKNTKKTAEDGLPSDDNTPTRKFDIN